MICVSIAEPTIERCIKALKRVKFAEIRIDKMNASVEKIAHIFSLPNKQFIATCRPNEKNDNERKKLMLAAIDAGAAYVDIEVDANEEYKKELIKHAKKKNCKVIVSYHNYEKTPKAAELDQIVKWCFESGANIAKIACKSNSNADNVRLLALLNSDKKLIVIGMGKKGKITRIVAPLLGSQFTFASVSKRKETAEGQINVKALEKLLLGN